MRQLSMWADPPGHPDPPQPLPVILTLCQYFLRRQECESHVKASPQGHILLQLVPKRHRPRSLELWHTPTARDGHGPRRPPLGTTPNGKRPDGKKAQIGLNDDVHFYAADGAPTFPDIRKGVARWPTPDARDAQAEGLACGQRRWERYHTAGLQTAVHLWAIPIARDYRSGVTLPDTAHAQRTIAPPPLNMQVSADGSLLNPVWVECLMGYPPGWTECAAPPAPP